MLSNVRSFDCAIFRLIRGKLSRVGTETLSNNPKKRVKRLLQRDVVLAVLQLAWSPVGETCSFLTAANKCHR